jgi:hypothetical protein
MDIVSYSLNCVGFAIVTLIARFGPTLTALIEVGTRDPVARPEELFRYQYSNNINSPFLDLNEKAKPYSLAGKGYSNHSRNVNRIDFFLRGVNTEARAHASICVIE